MIPYGRQDIDEDDIDAVVRVLRSPWLTQGPAVEQFERDMADRCDSRYSVAVANGTAALHLACAGLGVGEGDLVWTSPNTFAASANCARYLGADVGFVDIDPGSLNLDPDALEARLESAARAGRLPKVIIPVHFAGLPCDMVRIGAIARRYGVKVIEDACHALGATEHGRPVGACDHSHAVVFSFHPVKIITTGEGGMVMTQDEGVGERVALLRAHGIVKDIASPAEGNDGPWYYEQLELGFNYRLTDIQAALGSSQLRRLDSFVQRRAEIADAYDAELRELPVVLPPRRAEASSAWHLYVIRVDSRVRASVFADLRAAGIGVQVHYIPVHLHPYYRRRGLNAGDFPAAESYYREAISLPMYPSLTEEQRSTVVSTLRQSLERRL